MSNSSYKCTDKQLVSGLLAMIVVITTIFVMFDKHILPMFVDSLTTTKSSAVTNTTNKVTYNIHHLYQLPDGRKISVGYYNTNTYVAIPEDTQLVSHVKVWALDPLVGITPDIGCLQLRVYPPNTTVFNEANSTVLRFNFPMKNAKKWDEPILVYTDDLRKWLDDISSSQQN